MTTSAFKLATPAVPGFREITPAAAYHARRTARLIDVREPFELAGGFIPGSENIPLGQLAARARGWGKDIDLIVICRSGHRSGLAASQLAANGFSRVMNMTGGMVAYAQLGLPVGRSDRS
jgi:rhodanese-related sulfurtransferase